MSKLFTAQARFIDYAPPDGDDYLGVAPDGTAVVVRRFPNHEPRYYVVAVAPSVTRLRLSERTCAHRVRLCEDEKRPTADAWLRAQAFAAVWNNGEVLLPMKRRWAHEFVDILHSFDGTPSLMPDVASAASRAVSG